MRCRWCGRFVPRGTEPIPGVNIYGDPVTQILCPEHAPMWVMMAAANVYRRPWWLYQTMEAWAA